MKKTLWIFFIGIILFSFCFAQDVQETPSFIYPIIDSTNTLSDSEYNDLYEKLKNYSDTTSTEESKEDSKYIEIKSPIIGTFYRKPSPDKPVFAKVGDTVDVGDTVCIIEAMKLFNEVESEISGKIVKILIDDSSPVEFDQPLYLVDPS